MWVSKVDRSRATQVCNVQIVLFKSTFSSTIELKGSLRPCGHSCSQLQPEIVAYLRSLAQFGAGHPNGCEI